MNSSTRRYIIEVFENGEWVRPFKVVSSSPSILETRVARYKASGVLGEDQLYRILDMVSNEEYVKLPVYVLTEEEIAERVRRKEEYEARQREYWRANLEEVKAAVAKENEDRAVAEAALADKTVSTVEDFIALSDNERKVLVERVADAYASTNLGYGDEGNGYNVEQFVKLMLEMGWKFQ